MDPRERVEKEAQRLQRLLENEASRGDADRAVSRAIHLTAGVCAVVAMQPLPFADLFILTPIQITLAYRIARLRGLELSKDQAKRVLSELAGVVGLGYAAQQAAIALYKIGLPGFGGIMTLPLVYGLTYGIGRVTDYYYVTLAKGDVFDIKKARRIFKSARKEGKRSAQAEGVCR